MCIDLHQCFFSSVDFDPGDFDRAKIVYQRDMHLLVLMQNAHRSPVLARYFVTRRHPLLRRLLTLEYYATLAGWTDVDTDEEVEAAIERFTARIDELCSPPVYTPRLAE